MPLAFAQSPPRYRLEPGVHLVYERRVERTAVSAVGGEDPERYVEQVDLYVIERRGVEQLVLATAARIQEQALAPSRGLLVWVDERGVQRFPDPELAHWDSAADVLDILPTFASALERSASWLTPPDPYGRAPRERASAGETHPQRCFEWRIEDATGASEILGEQSHGRYCFDADRGFIISAESESSDPSGVVRATIRFREKTIDPPAWTQRRVAEVERYLRSRRVEDVARDDLVTRPDQARQAIERIQRIWTEFLDVKPRDDDSPLRALARGRLARLPDERAALLERAQLAGGWLARPAAQWSLQDLDGNTVRSEDVRKGPTLEYFWSAQSGASLRTFAALRGLQAAFPEDKLHIVCLNIDQEPALARRAAERCGPRFLHVLSGPPLRAEAPPDLPIIRVLDREARIQRVIFGWRPSLLEVVKPYVR